MYTSGSWKRYMCNELFDKDDELWFGEKCKGARERIHEAKGENVVPSELRFLSSARCRLLQGSVGICTSKAENVRELKRDPISQAIECGDCHLSNGWRRAFYKRTVKCANRRSVPPLHFNQIISLLCASRLKGSRGTKGFNLSLCFFVVTGSCLILFFYSLCFNVPRSVFNALFWASIVTRERNEPWHFVAGLPLRSSLSLSFIFFLFQMRSKCSEKLYSI